jgi:hypothetical protein
MFLNKLYKTTILLSRYQWLMPVILSTWEAEIRRIMVQTQPMQIVRPISKINKAIRVGEVWEGASGGGRNDPNIVCTYE